MFPNWRGASSNYPDRHVGVSLLLMIVFHFFSGSTALGIIIGYAGLFLSSIVFEGRPLCKVAGSVPSVAPLYLLHLIASEMHFDTLKAIDISTSSIVERLSHACTP